MNVEQHAEAILSFEPRLKGISSREPSLKQIIAYYYRSHGCEEWEVLTDEFASKMTKPVEAAMIASGYAVWDAMISAGEMAVHVDPIAVVKGMGK